MSTLNVTDVWASQLGMPASGEATFPPLLAVGNLGLDGGSGGLNLTYWIARKGETITTLGCSTQSTAAAATPTVCRLGLYTVDSSGNLTLVASTPNDTSLFSGTSTKYEKSLSASYGKTAGQLYAMGVLVVSGTTLPSFLGSACPPQITGSAGLGFTWSQKATGYSDLPSSVAVGLLSNRSTGPILFWCR